MKAPRENKRPNLAIRAAIYLVYSAFVWVLLRRLAGFAPDLDAALGKIAAVNVLASTSFFAVLAWMRRRESSPWVEYLLGCVGRTFVPCLCAFVGFSHCEPGVRRSFAVVILIAYYAIAPAHVVLTFPPEPDGNAELEGEESTILSD